MSHPDQDEEQSNGRSLKIQFVSATKVKRLQFNEDGEDEVDEEEEQEEEEPEIDFNDLSALQGQNVPKSNGTLPTV